MQRLQECLQVPANDKCRCLLSGVVRDHCDTHQTPADRSTPPVIPFSPRHPSPTGRPAFRRRSIVVPCTRWHGERRWNSWTRSKSTMPCHGACTNRAMARCSACWWSPEPIAPSVTCAASPAWSTGNGTSMAGRLRLSIGSRAIWCGFPVKQKCSTSPRNARHWSVACPTTWTRRRRHRSPPRFVRSTKHARHAHAR